ncbi:MAG: hypothetical protein CSB47_03490 [Proteobacteria bacterium]|nr:MAG: hypothetical protein CSB47_03490 [Pseudomonadota bacterium]
MLKNHAAFRMILIGACLWPVSHVSADVLSSTVTEDLREPTGTYDTDAPTLLNMKLKTVISEGACVTGDYSGCTLNDVLNDIDSSDDFKPEIRVHMTADDYPDDGLSSNAELRQRGSTSRGAPQKSFRVKLDKRIDLWRGERRIQLLKSFWDFSRIRNKLSYDLFVDIPNLPSMRTQFVKLRIEDQGVTENYGLYTQVEHFGKEYLRRRGWDDDSGVYKSENFYFKMDSAFALDENGEPIDEDAFEELMEIKRGDDHRAFVAMLEDLNNPDLDFESQVFDKYYNKDNYLTWFAVNILLDNYDTNFHNYYLYNPKGTEKFYFVPWDYDLSLGALFDTNESQRTDLARWIQSHANWWGQEIHQQFLRQPGNLDLLKEAVREVKNKYLTRAKLQEKADSYYDIVFPLISSQPDIRRLYLGDTDPEKIAAYNRIFSSLADRVEENYEQFLETIGDPMPFNLEEPEKNEAGGYTFKWSESESILGQTIRYDLEVSTSKQFDEDDLVVRETGIQGRRITIPWPYEAGRYYYRVIARDADAPTQYWQVAYDPIIMDDGSEAFGIVAFDATPDSADAFPVGVPDTASVNSGGSVVIDVLANDGGSGLYIAFSDPWSEKGGSVSISDNKINYSPKPGFTGTDRLWYDLADSQGRRTFSVVTITVSNDASSDYPVANLDYVDTTAGNSVVIDVLANDTGDGLYIAETDEWSEKGGSVFISNNKINYSPKPGFTGTDRLWYDIADSQGRRNFSEVTITVSGDDNTAYPVANRDYVSTTPGSTLVIDVLANDTGSGLVIDSTDPYSLKGGRVSIENNRIVYRPKSGFTGEDKLWYNMKDNQGRLNSARVTITVEAESAYPVAYADNITTSVGTAILFNPLENDTGTNLQVIDVDSGSEQGGTVEIVDGQLRYTPRSGFSGTDEFWYAMSDNQGRTNSAKVTVVVN